MLSRRLVVRVAAFLLLFFLLSGAVRVFAGAAGFARPEYLLVVFVVSVVGAYLVPVSDRPADRKGGRQGFLRSSEFLCDSCRYDNNRDCSRPERPNATDCPDFRPR